ncbi:MAG: 3,4-dihydroxy-2-butanone-4-phosphate synthase [Chloroflexi bacterium]|nr:3,4-dihydroxy-2-butanone-4-phosphate synthase [Chloroflexota bacterium]
MSQLRLNAIEEALRDLRAARPIIVVDDADRENEGDLVIAAQFATPEIINFMARKARGLICIAMPGPMLDRLGIPLMVPSAQNTSEFSSPFTISVDARTGVTTGISAYDRAQTIRVLIDPSSAPEDIAMPGHIFPLRAHPQGVLARRGHTEAGVDLARLAGLTPAAVICEIMAEDGSMARLPELHRFADEHRLKIISIADLVNYRLMRDARAQAQSYLSATANPIFSSSPSAKLHPPLSKNFRCKT